MSYCFIITSSLLSTDLYPYSLIQCDLQQLIFKYIKKSHDIYVVLCNRLLIHQVERLTFMSYYVELVM